MRGHLDPDGLPRRRDGGGRRRPAQARGRGVDAKPDRERDGERRGGAEALANYFAEKWSRIEAFARTGTFDATEDYGVTLSDDELLASGYVQPRVDLDEVADRDWMQMAWLLRYECRDLFIEMLLVLRAKARAFDLGLEEGDETPAEEDDGKFETSETDRGKATPAARASDEESAI